MWWQVYKPDKKVETIDLLFDSITQLFHLNKDDMISIWSTFPQNMQTAIWETMLKKIENYGKNIE